MYIFTTLKFPTQTLTCTNHVGKCNHVVLGLGYIELRYHESDGREKATMCTGSYVRLKWSSLCHLSRDSSMVRAFHKRYEGCSRIDFCLGFRNIFMSLQLSLSNKQFTFKLPSCNLLIRYTDISRLLY